MRKEIEEEEEERKTGKSIYWVKLPGPQCLLKHRMFYGMCLEDANIWIGRA